MTRRLSHKLARARWRARFAALRHTIRELRLARQATRPIEPAGEYLNRMRLQRTVAEPHKIPRPFILASRPSLPGDRVRVARVKV